MVDQCISASRRPLLVMLLGSVFASAAHGDALTDIQVSVSAGKLLTDLTKYAGAFDETTFETIDPGFAGSPPQGQQYGVQIAQKLWYHSGIVGDPVTPVPGNVFVRVADATTAIDVSGSSGLQAGLVLTGSLSGSLHGHLDFTLFPNTAPKAAAGVYGLVMQVNSPSFQASDPFLVAFANLAGGSLTLEGIEYGEDAIYAAAFAAVPEPSSVVLAGLGVAGWLAAAWRRRRAATPGSAAPEVGR